MEVTYKRILLKMSGEFLMGRGEFGIDPVVLDRVAREVTEAVQLGVEVGLVIGGGNLFRGATLSAAGLGRITGDHMGMLATLMNALAMRDAIERAGQSAVIMSSIPMSGIVDHYDCRKAKAALTAKQVVIFAAGTGNPLFTTDSAASLRGIEIEADVVLKATKVDGVFSADPVKDPDAEFFPRLSFDTVINKNLQVMDMTAMCLCREYGMPVRVFNIRKHGALRNVILGHDEGTLVEH